MPPKRSLDDVRAITDAAERARAVAGYIEQAEQAITDARKVRRDAIAELLEEPNAGKRPTALAKQVGVSVSTVKNIRDGRA